MRRPPRSTRFPYAALFRSARRLAAGAVRQQHQGEGRADGGEPCEVAPAEEGQHCPLRDEHAEHDERNLRQRCGQDRKSTRLNYSHANISYAVSCWEKKK